MVSRYSQLCCIRCGIIFHRLSLLHCWLIGAFFLLFNLCVCYGTMNVDDRRTDGCLPCCALRNIASSNCVLSVLTRSNSDR